MKKTSFITFILIGISLFIGYNFGKNTSGASAPEVKTGEEITVRQSGYTFINPLLECENNGSFAKQKYIPFEKDIVKKINQSIAQSNSGVLLSVYFRNLNNGPWFGIRENEAFIPASLMKVTLLMSYMRWSEDEPDILERKLKIEGNASMNQLIVPEKKLIPGNEYTIRDLLHYLIVYSDNNASRTLFAYIPPERHNKTFTDLGVTLPNMDNPNYTVTVKEYASFFRVLYNASYLSKRTSEEALKILTESTYQNGIVANIPANIPIAHKFGEREVLYDDGTSLNQLHDCGIVYHPAYPYLLCIMTRGNEPLADLSIVIKDTSKIIYDEISRRYPLQ